MGFLTLLILGLAAWIATSTIVEAEIFRDVREWCDKCHGKFNNWFTYKLRYLINCHMCTGIWVSAVISLLVSPLIGSGFVGWGLTALTIKGMAHVFLVIQKLAEAWTDKATRQNEIFVDVSIVPSDLPEYDLGDVASGYAPEVVNIVNGQSESNL